MKYNIIHLFLFLLFGIFSANATDVTWRGKKRQLNYKPDGEVIVTENGKNRFTRAIYGTNTPFRFETSDFPEFGLYMPRLGGSLYLIISDGKRNMWVKDAERIIAGYAAGKRTYKITDPILNGGEINITALAMGDADGLILKLETENVPDQITLKWVFGGANNERFRREGDLGADKPDCFYIKPERALNNRFDIDDKGFCMKYGFGTRELSRAEAYENSSAQNAKKIEKGTVIEKDFSIVGQFSDLKKMITVDAALIDSDIDALLNSTPENKPLIVVETGLSPVSYLTLYNPESLHRGRVNPFETIFNLAEERRLSIASRVKINTPDPYINPIGANMATVADALWESPVFLHGSIGWRVPLPGWRVAYAGDFLGWHDRGREHFRAYARSQITQMPHLPVIMDSLQNYARTAQIVGTPMYSSGYIGTLPNDDKTLSYYDMNLVFFDALLWHLDWTGDMEFAKEMWPVIERHLAWEKRNFDPNDDGLYDAYCCIWASDALQYTAGDVTHSSAYNYRANKLVARLADKLGLDSKPFSDEAQKIMNAANDRLWLKDKGWWAEYAESTGKGRTHESAAMWTMYHAIDSEMYEDMLTPYQATSFLIHELPKISVVCDELDDKENYVLSTTNWMPYRWSINNVAATECFHSALSLWQSGRSEEAYKLFKGSALDMMYMGKSPGNFGLLSYYNSNVGETYRDFSDPVGTCSRAMVQGLFGIYPKALDNEIEITPGFPSDWNFASIETSDLSFSFNREGLTDTYHFIQDFDSNLDLSLIIPVQTNALKSLTVNGENVEYTILKNQVIPKIRVKCGDAKSMNIEIKWMNKPVNTSPVYQKVIAKNDIVSFELPFETSLVEIVDPQQILTKLKNGRRNFTAQVGGEYGHRTFFAKVRNRDFEWLQAYEFEVVEPILVNYSDTQSGITFSLANQTGRDLELEYVINHGLSGKLFVKAGKTSQEVTVPNASLFSGTNSLSLSGDGLAMNTQLISWKVNNTSKGTYEVVKFGFNDGVNNIFLPGKYMSPRPKQGTLQIPAQGMGEWCVTNLMATIDDSGLRAKSVNNIFMTPLGIPFFTPGTGDENNILFTSLWDNYPDSVSIALTGKSSHAYLMMAGSTNHMQSRFVNGKVTVEYEDGSSDILELINPETWHPIEQDYYHDGFAYNLKTPRPYRVSLKNGNVSLELAKSMGVTRDYPRDLPGGAATILDLPLNPNKELKSMTVSTEANEVVIGLMGVTLLRL